MLLVAIASAGPLTTIIGEVVCKAYLLCILYPC